MMVQADQLLEALWAKKDDKDGNLCWLPLMTHLDDTMRVARWLWMNWLSDGQRAFCIRSIDPSNEETAVNLAGFLGAVHDIGKATPVFQTQKVIAIPWTWTESCLKNWNEQDFMVFLPCN